MENSLAKLAVDVGASAADTAASIAEAVRATMARLEKMEAAAYTRSVCTDQATTTAAHAEGRHGAWPGSGVGAG